MQQANPGEPQSSVSQSGLVLPNQSVQNQIHELAKTLPPPRKQNTACDACRARKVKCNRLPGQDKCQHCLSKNYPCTHYVQQATSERKRSSAMSRRPRNLSSSHPSISPTVASKLVPGGENGNSLGSRQTSFHNTLGWRPGFYPSMTVSTPTREVLAYVFSPPDQLNNPNGYGQLRNRTPYADWGDLANRLEDEGFRAEFALDLVEVFFQIVHTRIPLLNPDQFRKRLNAQINSRSQAHEFPSVSEKPLHPALVATVLAWGAKFSEHPLLVADRQRPGGQSSLARTAIDRARELAEAMKVHRVATPDHVVIGLLIEPLQSQNPDDPHGFHGFWLTSATRNLLDLQINHKSVMANIQDPEARGTMIFAWWMACLSDSYASVYYRRKPVLDDDDYDIDFYTAEPVTPETVERSHGPSPREQLEFLGYYRAAHALARIARQMSRQLWRPVTESDGVPFETLCGFTTALSEWRDQYLTVVGVPSNFEAEWDFVSAVSACASDATYHVMWIILFNALDDFGVREVNEVVRMGSPASVTPNYLQIDATKRKVTEEASHGALRIAGLAGVLTSNGYLRLDPAVMHVSCIQAGTFLARLGRPEAMNCIAGLEQYSYSYEEAGDQASDMKRTYHVARSGEFDFNNMASVVPRLGVLEPSHNMAVDEPARTDSASSANSRSSSYSSTIYSR